MGNTKSKKKFIICCLAPVLILTIFFFAIPLVRGLALSFTNATSTSIHGKFIGLENYIYMFTSDDFYQALFNTLKIIIIFPAIVNFMALIFAFFITQGKLRESSFYRFLFFFPNIIAATAVGVLWSNIYSPTMGLFKKFFETIGMESVANTPILGKSQTVLIAIIIVMIWQTAGYYIVMYIAAIDGIDESVYEAATIDGCGVTRKIINITMPLLKDMIGITFVLSISGAIGMSYIITAIMTSGGPSGSSTVLLYYMYQQAFELSNFGYAMSIAVFTMFMSFILSLISRRLSR
jgi:N-acetylglucosamine transport system permease protein